MRAGAFVFKGGSAVLGCLLAASMALTKQYQRRPSKSMQQIERFVAFRTKWCTPKWLADVLALSSGLALPTAEAGTLALACVDLAASASLANTAAAATCPVEGRCLASRLRSFRTECSGNSLPPVIRSLKPWIVTSVQGGWWCTSGSPSGASLHLRPRAQLLRNPSSLSAALIPCSGPDPHVPCSRGPGFLRPKPSCLSDFCPFQPMRVVCSRID